MKYNRRAAIEKLQYIISKLNTISQTQIRATSRPEQRVKTNMISTWINTQVNILVPPYRSWFKILFSQPVTKQIILYTTTETWQIGWTWPTAWNVILAQTHGNNFWQFCLDLKLQNCGTSYGKRLYFISSFDFSGTYKPAKGWTSWCCIIWQLQLHGIWNWEEFQLDNFFDDKISLHKVLGTFHLQESKTPCTASYSPSAFLF